MQHNDRHRDWNMPDYTTKQTKASAVRLWPLEIRMFKTMQQTVKLILSDTVS